MYNRQLLTDFVVRVARAARAGELHNASNPFEGVATFQRNVGLSQRPGNSTEFDDAAVFALVVELERLLGAPERGG